MLPSPLLASLALAALPQDAPQEPRSLLEAVPTDAVMVMVVEDFPALWERSQASAWADVLRAPAFGELWALLDESLGEALDEDLLSDAGLTVREFVDAFHSAALYLYDLEGDEPLGGLVLLRLRQDRPRVRELLQVALENDEDGELVEQDGRDLRLAGPDGDGEWTAALDWRDGFAVSFHRDRERALGSVVALARRLEEGAPDGGLAARLGDRSKGARAALQFHVDLGAIGAGQGQTMDEEERAAWKAFALDELGWLSVRATLGEGVATEVSTRVELPASGLIARWAACARPVPVELADLAPADASEVAVLGFNAHAAWAILREAIQVVMPEQDLDSALEAARGTTGIDLEQDLIEQLTGEFAEIVVPVDVDPSGDFGGMETAILSAMRFGLVRLPGFSPGSVLVVGLRDTEPVEELLESLLELGNAGELIEDERVGERWMTSIRTPDIPFEPSWAFLDEALVFSLDAGPVRAVLAQSAEEAPASWLDDEEHRKALTANEAAFGASLADLGPWLQAELVQPLVWMAGLVEQMSAFYESPSSSEEEELLQTVFGLVDALPELVAEHLRGSLHGALWIEGNVLRYDVWTR